jgi:4-amino-4-deoxy-L-arabinose transferase-like glycosyltransferase
MQRRPVRYVALFVVLLLAAVLRIYDLKNVPAGLFCDEAGNGYNAYALGTAGIDENGVHWPLYVWSFGVSYKNPIFIYAAILPVKLLGLDEFSVRLTAAVFGIATVAALFWLGSALFNPWVGLWSALFLAVCPWHLHFSRIAFELIAFPFLFVCGFALLVCYTQGRRTLPAALLFLSLCIYSYAVAALFVPLFLLGFGVLYLPSLLRRWGETLLMLMVVAATLAPAALFFGRQTRAGTQYFRHTTFLEPQQDWRPQAERFAHNYVQFFSPEFLFERGDRLRRHSVRGFGELYRFYLPFLLLGAAVVLLRRNRASKLVLWWVLLYPIGPSLMTEIPSASRGFIGSAGLCLLTGIGFAAALRALSFALRRRAIHLPAQVAAVAAAAAFLLPEVKSYLHAYFVDYPTYSALTPGGFQYGYRDVIHYMETQRGKYERLMLTATDVNQPYIFPLFYRPIDPRDWVARHDTGYTILAPNEFSRYSMRQSILYALDPRDMDLFSDYDVEKRVVAPGGRLAYLVADVRARKRYLGDWVILGLFPNGDLRGIERDFIDPRHPPRQVVQGAFGPVGWRPLSQGSAEVNLNVAYATADPGHRGNPERVCAYALTTVHAPQARSARLEVSGSRNDTLRAWLDGRSLTPWPLTMGESPRYRSITLSEGDNTLLVQSCEDIGNWEFSARITDEAGRDLTDVSYSAAWPQKFVVRADPEDARIRPVSGFRQTVASAHEERSYPDYRGASRSWRARMDDASELTWQTAPAPEDKQPVFVFTASTSDEKGEFALFVDGEYALTFESDSDRGMRSWRRNGYELTFVSKARAAGNSGIMLLAVPPGRVAPGKPADLRVAPITGNRLAWFMIKAYTDTVSQEHITPEMAVEALRGGWKERPLDFPWEPIG